MAYQAYYAAGGIAGRSLANGATSQWGYDAFRRPAAILQGAAGIAADAGWSFAYNPAGQLASQARDNDAFAFARPDADASPTRSTGSTNISG